MSKSSKKNVPKKNSSVRPYTVMCTDLYLLWILLVYPLYYADGYFHLPERKATFWCTSTLIYIGVTLLGVIITYVSTRDEWSLERIKKNISMTDIFMFGFLISNLIAFALSEDKTNAWTGAGARYYGAKVLILVCISYFLISRYAWVNKVFIWAFLIGGNGVCLLATLDYFWLDVLGINGQMLEGDRLIFISTMGNANTCASYVTMAVTVAIAYYCIAGQWWEKIFAGISIMNCSIALITCRSDSASLGVVAAYVFIVALVFIGKVQVEKFLETIMLLLMTMIIFKYVRKKFMTNIMIYYEWDTGVPGLLIENTKLWVVLLVGILLLYSIIRWGEKKKNSIVKKKATVSIKLLFPFLGMITVALLFKLHIFQVFQKSMGGGLEPGSRLYMYTRAFGSYAQSTFVHKIFGNGQASIANVLNRFYGTELSSAGISINTVHNHVLDYLIIGGLVCAICFGGVCINSLRHVWSNSKTNFYVVIFGGAVIAYFVQGFFNIEQANTTVLFWLFIAVVEALNRQEKDNTSV